MAAERMTTVKVSVRVRDQLNAYAAERGLTANSAIEGMLADLQWRQRVELAKKQMREAPPEVWADYMEEFHTMDGSLSDGLGGDPWQG